MTRVYKPPVIHNWQPDSEYRKWNDFWIIQYEFGDPMTSRHGYNRLHFMGADAVAKMFEQLRAGVMNPRIYHVTSGANVVYETFAFHACTDKFIAVPSFANQGDMFSDAATRALLDLNGKPMLLRHLTNRAVKILHGDIDRSGEGPRDYSGVPVNESDYAKFIGGAFKGFRDEKHPMRPLFLTWQDRPIKTGPGEDQVSYSFEYMLPRPANYKAPKTPKTKH